MHSTKQEDSVRRLPTVRLQLYDILEKGTTMETVEKSLAASGVCGMGVGTSRQSTEFQGRDTALYDTPVVKPRIIHVPKPKDVHHQEQIPA